MVGRYWQPLLLTGLLYRTLAVLLLFPLVLVFFRGLLACSGRAFLTDADFLFLLTGPWGWLCLVLVGACWLSVTALEVASLLIILASDPARPLGPVAAIWLVVVRAPTVLRVTAHIVGRTVLTAAPFIALTAVAYLLLLDEHDINFYLQTQPPVFLAAMGIGVLLACLLLAVLLRLFTSWFFALPLVLFEGIAPAAALTVSSERATGRRWSVLCWLLGWWSITVLLSFLLSLALIELGRTIVPAMTSSLSLLTVAIGVSLLLWLAIQTLLQLLSVASLAAVLFAFHRQSGRVGLAGTRPGALGEDPAGLAAIRLTLPRLLVVATIGVLSAAITGVLTVASLPLEDHVAVIAHRGASLAAPENTLAAVRQAIADGADCVEVDVQETADGAVVVFHDSDFMRLAGKDLKIWRATLDDLQAIDIGSRFHPRFNAERVPTLQSVLDACQGKVRVIIELKYYGHDQQLEQRVVNLIESRNGVDDVEFMSLKMGAVRKLKSMRPAWTVGLLMSVSAGRLQNIEADFVATNTKFATPGFIRAAQRAGKDVYVWTVNDAVSISTMIGRGVQGIITDRPERVRAVLAERAEMSLPERLLLELAGALGVTPRALTQ